MSSGVNSSGRLRSTDKRAANASPDHSWLLLTTCANAASRAFVASAYWSKSSWLAMMSFLQGVVDGGCVSAEGACDLGRAGSSCAGPGHSEMSRGNQRLCLAAGQEVIH